MQVDFHHAVTCVIARLAGFAHPKVNSIADSAQDVDDEPFTSKDSFLTRDWKRFHDAQHAHRFDVIHEILPQYGISAA